MQGMIYLKSDDNIVSRKSGNNVSGNSPTDKIKPANLEYYWHDSFGFDGWMVTESIRSEWIF